MKTTETRHNALDVAAALYRLLAERMEPTDMGKNIFFASILIGMMPKENLDSFIKDIKCWKDRSKES